MLWKPFVYAGKVYDLSHLHPASFKYRQDAKDGKPDLIYNTIILFSLHCFTRALGPAEQCDAALFYSDDRETRVFDFTRYELSKRLPEVVRSLPKRKCYHTGKGNFFSIEIIDERGKVTEYDVFFVASRGSGKGVLNLFVQSAYLRDAEHGTNRPHKKPIGFYVILFNVLNNKPIWTPK